MSVRSGTLRAAAFGRGDGFLYFSLMVAALVPVVLVVVALGLFQAALPSIRYFGAHFLVSQIWNPVTQQFGALPFLYGTVATSGIALLLAIPVGVGTAVFLAEPNAGRIRGAIGIGVELLAAIPSVVYGLWALYVMGPWVLLHVSSPLAAWLGRIPAFAGPARQTSLLTASLIVSVMILPTLAAISRDVIRAVPRGLRESSVALGATWWETTWGVILPAARAGIFGAAVLALGRALGETIAVTMVIGNRPAVGGSILAPAYTLASVIANEFNEATGRHYAALLELGLLLVLITLVINVAALLLVQRGQEAAR